MLIEEFDISRECKTPRLKKQNNPGIDAVLQHEAICEDQADLDGLL